jgi:hypothetical protein
LSALLLAVAASPATAQEVFGLVTDEILDIPVAQVAIEFTSTAEGVPPVAVVAGGDGRFHLGLPGAGSYYLQVSHLYYEPILHGPIEVAGPEERIELLIELTPRPALLDGISVEARREVRQKFLERAGFYHRASTSQGRFVTPEDLEGRRFSYQSILRGIPGVRVSAGDQIRFVGRGATCLPHIYVDGARIFSSSGLRGAVPLQDVDAIEIYRGLTVPIEYAGTRDRPCGVILFWTRG